MPSDRSRQRPNICRMFKGERRDSNPRPPGPQPGALPTELRPPSCPNLPAFCRGAVASCDTRRVPFDPANALAPYVADADRYERMPYRRVGRSGLQLPLVSLGLWQNFGDDRPLANSRAILRRAFDLGVTHFDLANNYGRPYGSAEINFGRIFREDFRPHRDELVISTKAGYDMWPGPYGEWGSRKYLLASLDQSLERMGLDHVDIFYSHRFDPQTPLEETLGALDTAVRQGKALYAGSAPTRRSGPRRRSRSSRASARRC